jgi:hypothetical protein
MSNSKTEKATGQDATEDPSQWLPQGAGGAGVEGNPRRVLSVKEWLGLFDPCECQGSTSVLPGKAPWQDVIG